MTDPNPTASMNAADLFCPELPDGPLEKEHMFPPGVTEEELKVYARVLAWRMQWNDHYGHGELHGIHEDILWREYALASTELARK